MNKFKNYEVVTPKFKSWDKGLRVKVNKKYSLYNMSKPGNWYWKYSFDNWGVCLTSDLNERFVFPFTKGMNWEDALEFANKYVKL